MTTDPTWLDTAAIIGTAAGAMVLGIFGGRKTAPKAAETVGEATVVAGAFAGPGQVADLSANIRDAVVAMNHLAEEMKSNTIQLREDAAYQRGKADGHRR